MKNRELNLTMLMDLYELTMANGIFTSDMKDNITYFDRDGMYCHPDEAERFAFFDKAVTEFMFTIAGRREGIFLY